MKRRWVVATCLVLAAGAAIVFHEHARNTESGEALKHVRNNFEFAIDAPVEKAFPLFGANRERVWAPGWNPQFVYPLPAEDVAGAVFRVKHGNREAVWVNTAFDAASGHVQYAYVLPDVMVTLIDIQLIALDAGRTQAKVIYERTALSEHGNALVTEHGESDSKAGPEWAAQINGYFRGYLQKTGR